MERWKSLLYERYESTQAPAPRGSTLRLADYPYFVRLIREHVPADRSQRIVDLGCGHGALVHCLRALGYQQVSGVDVSSEQVAAARRLGIDGITEGELLSFLAPQREAFDVIFLLDVLEHFGKGEVIEILQAVLAALRPGGRLILHVPNGAGLLGGRVFHGDFTHETCFTEQSAQQVLAAVGFSAIAIYEDRPTLHSAAGVLRRGLYELLTLPHRLLSIAETGVLRHVLSQNLLAVAQKPRTS